MITLYLCGAGNPEGVRLALLINQASERWDRIVLLDDNRAVHGQTILGLTIAGSFRLLEQADRDTSVVANLVARTTEKRWAARRAIASYGLPFAPLIHPTVDTFGATYGQDIIAYRNATIGTHSSIGDGSVVFMGATVGHGSRLGPCCVVAPNAVINARAELAEGVYVGTNASILPELKIGAWATIAAGSVAMTDVPSGATVLGVPGEIFMVKRPAGEAVTIDAPAAATGMQVAGI